MIACMGHDAEGPRYLVPILSSEGELAPLRTYMMNSQAGLLSFRPLGLLAAGSAVERMYCRPRMPVEE